MLLSLVGAIVINVTRSHFDHWIIYWFSQTESKQVTKWGTLASAYQMVIRVKLPYITPNKSPASTLLKKFVMSNLWAGCNYESGQQIAELIQPVLFRTVLLNLTVSPWKCLECVPGCAATRALILCQRADIWISKARFLNAFESLWISFATDFARGLASFSFIFLSNKLQIQRSVCFTLGTARFQWNLVW